MMRSALVLLFSFWMQAVWAATDVWEFDNQEQADRFNKLTEELRCPKCQNQNLADSNSPIAADLRKVVQRLIDEGKSDEEVKAWLVDRYGEYVLYRPEVKESTILLWGGPVLGLMLALAGLIVFVRRSSAVRHQQEQKPLSDEEKQALDQLVSTTLNASKEDNS